MQFKKFTVLICMAVLMVSCASWFGSSESVSDNPAVGGRQDSSDMLFGDTNNMPATGPGAYAESKMNASSAQ